MLAHNAGLAAAVWEVRSGVLQRHPACQVVDSRGRDLRQQADAAHRGRTHREVIHHEVATDLKGCVLVPHTDDKPRTEVVHSNPQAGQPVHICGIKLHETPAALAYEARLPCSLGQALAKGGEHALWDHDAAPEYKALWR